MSRSDLRIPAGNVVVRLGAWLPYIGIIVVAVAFFTVIGLGRPDLALRGGVYLALPVVLASIWLIRRRKTGDLPADEDAPPITMGRSRFIHLTLLNAVIFIVSIIVLFMSETRPPGYFVLMAAFAGVVFVQVLGTSSQAGWQKGVVLGALILLALNLTWSVTLKYPLYFGGTDIPPHLHFVQSILESSRVTPAMTGGYQHFPLYHIFFASGIQVLGLGLRDGFFVLAPLAYVPAVLFAYLVFKSVTGRERLSLVACLLLAVNAEFIYYGGYMITRALAFVLFTVILYLLLRQPRNMRTMALLGLITLSLVLTHQTTLVYAAGILALLVGFLWLLTGPHPGFQVRFATVYFAVFVVGFVSYWLIAAPDFVQSILSRLGPGEFVPPPGAIPPPPVDTTPPPAELPSAGFPDIIDLVRRRTADMLCLFFAWLGFAHVLRKATHRNYVVCAAIGSAALVGLVFYVQNPVHLVPQVRSVFLAQRLPILLAVFMSLVMAFGVVLVAWTSRHDRAGLAKKAVLPVLTGVIVAFSFFSMVDLRNASDASALLSPYEGDRLYFTEAELSAFSFVQDRIPSDIPVHSDYYARRYFMDRPARTITGPDISYIEGGSLLLRTGELEDRWLHFSSGSSDRYSYNLEDVAPADSILEYLALEDRVYDNGTTRVYMIGGR